MDNRRWTANPRFVLLHRKILSSELRRRDIHFMGSTRDIQWWSAQSSKSDVDCVHIVVECSGHFQLLVMAKDKIILIVAIFTTGFMYNENLHPLPDYTLEPLILSCIFHNTIGILFILYSHLDPITFIPWPMGTNDHVPFDEIASISSDMAFLHSSYFTTLL